MFNPTYQGFPYKESTVTNEFFKEDEDIAVEQTLPFSRYDSIINSGKKLPLNLIYNDVVMHDIKRQLKSLPKRNILSFTKQGAKSLDVGNEQNIYFDMHVFFTLNIPINVIKNNEKINLYLEDLKPDFVQYLDINIILMPPETEKNIDLEINFALDWNFVNSLVIPEDDGSTYVININVTVDESLNQSSLNVNVKTNIINYFYNEEKYKFAFVFQSDITNVTFNNSISNILCIGSLGVGSNLQNAGEKPAYLENVNIYNSSINVKNIVYSKNCNIYNSYVSCEKYPLDLSTFENFNIYNSYIYNYQIGDAISSANLNLYKMNFINCLFVKKPTDQDINKLYINPTNSYEFNGYFGSGEEKYDTDLGLPKYKKKWDVIENSEKLTLENYLLNADRLGDIPYSFAIPQRLSKKTVDFIKSGIYDKKRLLIGFDNFTLSTKQIDRTMSTSNKYVLNYDTTKLSDNFLKSLNQTRDYIIIKRNDIDFSGMRFNYKGIFVENAIGEYIEYIPDCQENFFILSRSKDGKDCILALIQNNIYPTYLSDGIYVVYQNESDPDYYYDFVQAFQIFSIDSQSGVSLSHSSGQNQFGLNKGIAPHYSVTSGSLQLTEMIYEYANTSYNIM